MYRVKACEVEILNEAILVSLIVPVYNCSRYLEQCVESLINQTYSNIEIILIDDGSVDSSPDLCDKYAKLDSRIHVIHKENGGVTSARKAGIDLSQGDYLCCVDGDDYISLDYVKKMVDAIQIYNADIICCGYFIFDDNHEKECPISLRSGYYDQEDKVKNIFPLLIQSKDAKYFPPSLWAKAFKKDLLLKYHQLLPNSICIGEDGSVVIPSVYHATSLVILDDSLYFYRQNIFSVTKSKKSFDWEGPKQIAEYIDSNIDLSQWDLKSQWYRKTVHELFTVVCSQFNRSEPYRLIVKEICCHLDDLFYIEAIQNASFNGISGKLALFSLKNRCLFLIKVFNAIK